MRRFLLALLLVPHLALAGMHFDGTSSATAQSSSIESSLTAAPLTVCLQFNPNDTTTNYWVASLADTAADNDFFYLAFGGAVGGDPILATADHGGSEGFASSTSGFSSGSYQHACAVFTSSSSRAALLNGTNKGTDATSITPSSLDATAVGYLKRNSSIGYANGDIAEVGFWSRALADSEVRALGKGFSPACLRNGLVSHYSMWHKTGSTAGDPWGTTNLALTLGSGTSQATHHARVINCQ